MCLITSFCPRHTASHAYASVTLFSPTELFTAKCEPLSFNLCKDFAVAFDSLYDADPNSGTNPMRKDPSVSLQDKTTADIFNHVQFPTRYWYPQDHRGIVRRTNFGHGVTVYVETEYSSANLASREGMLYTFSNDAWEAYFGSAVTARMDFEGKQCRNGEVIYQGTISAFPPNSPGTHGYMGRRGVDSPWSTAKLTAGTFQWEDHDVIVKASDECAPSGSLSWPKTQSDGVFALVNPTSGKALTLGGTNCDGTTVHTSLEDESSAQILRWMEAVKAKSIGGIEDIPSKCHLRDYELGLYSFSSMGSHFFAAATSASSLGIDDECPASLVFASLRGRKVTLLIKDEHSLMQGFHSYRLGNVSLRDVMEAERHVAPIDNSGYDLVRNNCAHYAQRIWRGLQIRETAELADFLIENLLRDHGIVEYAKNVIHQGGLEVLSKFVSNPSILEEYVRDSVLSQLNIDGVESPSSLQSPRSPLDQVFLGTRLETSGPVLVVQDFDPR